MDHRQLQGSSTSAIVPLVSAAMKPNDDTLRTRAASFILLKEILEETLPRGPISAELPDVVVTFSIETCFTPG